MSKATKFWVDPGTYEPEDMGECLCSFKEHPGQGPLQWQASLIHVIEKSAYDKAVKCLKEISKETYEANPWTVVKTANAIKAENTLKELGELP